MPPDATHPHEAVLSRIDEGNLPALVLDPCDQEVAAVNESFLGVYGWAPGDVVGRQLDEIVAERHEDRVRDFASVLSFGRHPDPVQITLLDPDEGPRSTMWEGIPNLGGDLGDAVAVICRPRGATDGTCPSDTGILASEEAFSERWGLDEEQDSVDDHSQSLWD